MLASPIILDPEQLPSAGRRWDLVTICLLSALLVFMPAAFGAVESWSELVIVAGAAALSICVALRILFDRSFQLARTWLYVPLALFILLVAFQLLPLSTDLVARLSPHTALTKQELLSVVGEPPSQTTLSYYARETAHHLRLVLVGAAIFVTVASTFRTPRQIQTLLAIVFAIGCAEATLAIAQRAGGTSKIYWNFDSGQTQTLTSGSFINYSHFSQFINLSLGAGIALLLVRLREDRRFDSHRDRDWRELVRMFWERNGWIVCGIVISAFSVFISMSRNGALSLLIASVVIATMLYFRGTFRWSGWLLGALPLGVLLALLIFSFDTVYDRLATLHHGNMYASRLQLTRGTLQAFQAHPLFGTGLGTHEYVFPMYDESTSSYLAAHADNDYAQLLEETGLAGAVCVGLFVFGIIALIFRVGYRGHTPISYAVFGLAYGLLAVAIHSATDFGQHLPANFCLSAVACGLIVAIAGLEARSRADRRAAPVLRHTNGVWPRRIAAVAAIVVLAIVWTWAAQDAYAAFLGERWSAANSTLATRLRSDNDQDYIDLIAASDGAFASEPNNVKYGYALALNRWTALSRFADPDTGKPMLTAEELPYVAQIAEELAAVRRICPTYGPPYALEGELRAFVAGDPRGTELIDRAVKLAPYDPPTCLVAGELALRNGKIEDAQPLLERAVALNPAFYHEVIALYLNEARRPDLAKSLAGDDYQRLGELGKMCETIIDYIDLAPDLYAASEASLRRRAASPGARADELAMLANVDARRGEFASAVDLYRKALVLNYGQIEWRLELARALAKSGHLDEALNEISTALRIRPHYAAATQLQDELTSRRPPK